MVLFSLDGKEHVLLLLGQFDDLLCSWFCCFSVYFNNFFFLCNPLVSAYDCIPPRLSLFESVHSVLVEDAHQLGFSCFLLQKNSESTYIFSDRNNRSGCQRCRRSVCVCLTCLTLQKTCLYHWFRGTLFILGDLSKHNSAVTYESPFPRWIHTVQLFLPNTLYDRKRKIARGTVKLTLTYPHLFSHE